MKVFKENFKRWLSYCKPCFKGCFDFDFSSILLMERHQLERVRDNIAKYHNHVNAERDVERMNTALKLLDSILEEGSDILDFNQGKYKLTKYVNTKNAYRFGNYTEEHLQKPLWVADLYCEKTWKLYHRFREQWLRTWWD